jgi:hypothetical protein
MFGLLFGITVGQAQSNTPEAGEQSNSPGIPGHKPLHLISITNEDGKRLQDGDNISLKPKFNIEFDKNVVNILFWEKNRRCFTLLDQENKSIPINVTKIDDTVDFSKRQMIFVEPIATLQSGTIYYLKISPELMAKNGNSTLGGTTEDKGITIALKTVGKRIVPQKQLQHNVDRSMQSEDPVINDKNLSSRNKEGMKDIPTQDKVQQHADRQNAGHNITENQLKNEQDQKEENKGKTLGYYLKIVAIILTIAWIAMEGYIKINKKKGD